MRTGEQITLRALQRERDRLKKIADAAKAEADECLSVGSMMIDIITETQKIIKSGECGKDVLKKLNDLKRRQNRCHKIRKKNLIELLDRENSTRMEYEAAAFETSRLETRIQMRTQQR